jgi:hypothetical protein
MDRPAVAVAISALLMLSACAVGPPATTPSPSFLQNCAPVYPAGSPALTCEQAISAVLASLAPGHPRIEKVEFYYGYPCDPTASCDLGSGAVGYVLVQMAAPDSDVWIGVVRNPDGSLTTTTEPAAATSPVP